MQQFLRRRLHDGIFFAMLMVLLGGFALLLRIDPTQQSNETHYQQDYPQIKYGVLSWHYIWPNFVVNFLRWPSFNFTGPFDLKPQPDLKMDGVCCARSEAISW